MEHDDTDGHIDNLVCFARPGVVLALSESDQDDAHYQPMQSNLRRLRSVRDAQGRALDIIEIRQPERLRAFDVTLFVPIAGHLGRGHGYFGHAYSSLRPSVAVA